MVATTLRVAVVLPLPGGAWVDAPNPEPTTPMTMMEARIAHPAV